MENKGIKGHTTQHIGDLAHVEGEPCCGLIILRHLQLSHQTRTGQVQFFEGSVEYQSDSDVVLGVGVTGFWLLPVLGSRVASEKSNILHYI